jgi:hypothetical protein
VVHPLEIEEAAMRKAAFCTILLALGICPAGAQPAAFTPVYTYTEIHMGLGFYHTEVYAINASGQAVGFATSQDGSRAFVHLFPSCTWEQKGKARF